MTETPPAVTDEFSAGLLDSSAAALVELTPCIGLTTYDP